MISTSNFKLEKFKSQAPSVKWTVDLEIFEFIKDKIRSLSILTKNNEVSLTCNFL